MQNPLWTALQLSHFPSTTQSSFYLLISLREKGLFLLILLLLLTDGLQAVAKNLRVG